MGEVSFRERQVLGSACGFFAHRGSFRCGSVGRPGKKPRVPGQPQAQDGRSRHHGEARHAFLGFHEPLSEFCSQSHAPMSVRAKNARPTSVSAVWLSSRKLNWPHSIAPGAPTCGHNSREQGPRQAKIMAHRSNQVVASQDRASETPDEPPTARRLLVGWATALAALGVSTCLVGLGVWLARIPLAEFMIGAALAERGAEADFDVAELDFSHAVLTNIRFGSDTSPDAAAPRADARWVWEGLTPRLESIRIMEPQLRLRLDQGGRISAGTLDRLGAGAPGRRRPGISRVELEIVEGQALIEAPFGTLTASLRAEGRLGEDFSAIARIADTYHAWRGEKEAGEYADIPGYCKSATLEEVRKHGHVLTPGRYVGAEVAEDDGEAFADKMQRLSAQWREQQQEAARLNTAIEANLRELGYGG